MAFRTQTKQAAKQSVPSGAPKAAGQNAMKNCGSKSNGNYGRGQK